MNERINSKIGAPRPPPGRVAVMSTDHVLVLDLEMMLREAGYDVFEATSFDTFPKPEDNVTSAIVDMGEEPEAALRALIRLATEQIPHVVLGYEVQDMPLKMANAMLKGALYKPICVDELLPLLGQSLPAQRGFRRTP